MAEIPALLTFPEDVSIDLSTLGGESPSTGGLKFLAQTTGGSVNFSDAVALGPVTIAIADDLLNTLLQPLQSLEIPVSPKVRTFEGVINIPNIFPQKVKVDFAPFDFNGDGIPEGNGCTCPVGCSGDSCPSEAPVADLQTISYRIWIQNPDGNFEPFTAGLFDILAIKDDPGTLEDEENPGTGRFRHGFSGFPTGTAGETASLFFGVRYDHQDHLDPLFKATELFVQNKNFDSKGSMIGFDNFHSFVEQDEIQRAGIPDSLQKTAKLSSQRNPQEEGEASDIDYIGRFLEEFDFWSGSFLFTGLEGGVPKTVSEENLCVRISTGNETARENCLDLGIDVAGEAFLPPTTEADVAFPADFPPTPTF